MTSTCQNCGYRIVGGPTAVGCITTGGPAAVVTGVIGGILFQEIVWFALAALPMWFGLTWLFWEAPRMLMALRNRFRRCPHCGDRAWGQPEYSGFGL